jgi:hypothetical protein
MTNIRRFILSAAPVALGICMLAGQASASSVVALCGTYASSSVGAGTWNCPTWNTVTGSLPTADFTGEFVVYNNDWSGDFSGTTNTTQDSLTFSATGGTLAWTSDTLTSSGTTTSSLATSIRTTYTNGGLVQGNFVLGGFDNNLNTGGPAAVSIGYNISQVSGLVQTYSGNAYVVYEYTIPVTGAPEPTTLFLMGSALVGVGLLRKRIKA